jgi:16S rRNA (guanine1207-N2)-methyltransferase
MSRSRLSTLLEATDLPPGEVVALRPPAAYDLAALPRERTRIVHGFRPDRDAWAEAGWQVADEAGPAGTALVVVPRSKRLAQALVAQAAGAALVLVDGQRDHGIDSLWRDLRERRPEAEALTQGHGRLVRLEGGPDLVRAVADWAMPAPARGPDGLHTQPGVFGEGGADRASLLLAAALPPRLPARMADFGAGVGTLSRAVLAREGVEAVDLIEAEALALDCARLNVPDPRARFVWADATRGAFGPYDGAVMNPPFHQGRAPDPALGRAFIAAAARALSPQGQLWMVANRHLSYESALAEAFREVEPLEAGGGFKLIRAGHPKAAKGAARGVAREVVRSRRAR